MNEPLPKSCRMAFKEWAGVRDALASGRQTILLRKGGILEGPNGFEPEHSIFWIYPTHVHEAEQGLKPSDLPPRPVPPPGIVEIDTLACVESCRRLDDLDEVMALDDAHVWTEETIRKRFEYRKPGLWLLVTRILRRPNPLLVEIRPEDAGCKTWVTLEKELPTESLFPVLDHQAFRQRVDGLVARPATRPIPPSEVG